MKCVGRKVGVTSGGDGIVVDERLGQAERPGPSPQHCLQNPRVDFAS